ncbi:MAG: hypothetical protein KME10_12135 [Plectolyngbya sp. WJT66-NPBG17]|jgi:hypothetical protein|nr:hypothetical protein [Plectolyngbya sp. WJT66-NPBG17]
MAKFFGKYRGKVAGVKDPLHLGRIQVQVASIFGEGRLSWAMPCVPYAGKDVGLFTVPHVGSNIWVEFEGGDVDYPIWSGCFWGQDELPQALKVDERDKIQMFRTEGMTVTFNNQGENKGITIVVEHPTVERKLKMIFDANGIEINNKDETTIKIMADMIELKNRDNSTVTITVDTIDLKQSSVETKLTASTIDLTCNPATLKLSTSSGIELNNSPANAKFSSTGIELATAAASTKVTPAQIEMSNGAANIKLLPIAVNINNGALEVI